MFCLFDYGLFLEGASVLQSSPDFQFSTLQFIVLVGTLVALITSLIFGLLKMGARFQYLVGEQAENKRVTANIAKDLMEVNKSLQNTRTRVIHMDKDHRYDRKTISAMQQDISGIVTESANCQKETLKMFESLNTTMSNLALKVETHLEIHKDRERR